MITVIAQKSGHALSDTFQCAFPLRLENAVVANDRYISKTVWSLGLAAYYPHPVDCLPIAIVVGPALFKCFVTFCVLNLSRTKPRLFVG